MMLSAAIVSDEEDNLLLLTLDNNQLTVEPVDNKEREVLVIQLEFIYGIHFNEQEETLSVHYVSSTSINDTSNDSKDTSLLSNSHRPKDTLQWSLHTLHYKKATNHNYAASPLSEFVPLFQTKTLPHYASYSQSKIFVILNPTSGSQNSEANWDTIVKPMLLNAGFLDTNIVKINTERNGKTRALAEALGKRIMKEETAPIIISMGGDGTLHEVVNGLTDAISNTNEERQHRFRLGVIPAGSGNAFSLSLNIQSIEHAALKIIKGLQESSFYMMEVKLGHTSNWPDEIEYDKPPVRLLVVMSWGFHAQLVSKSRYLRYFMGNSRFSWIAMYLLTFLKQYQGDLILKNVKRYNPTTHQFDKQQAEMSTFDDKQFTYFVVSKQHSLEKGFRITPFASPLTEEMDIIMLRNADKDKLTKTSIGAFRNGQHVDIEGVEYFKSSEMLLRVKDRSELCLDGEIHDIQANGVIHLQTVSSSTKQFEFTIFI
ncbi:MAG: ATP-NAD kinase-like domain-containing protein [Benjaminiella poitrasii]|nr:MAG: ATP-NAD kinase-like domain-containing protein [Benjaminiella poitrasii]KAI9470740.1 MAG: ATP-NAD kinase-like domain-containing protein [Benjaminiella poitrasii]